MNGLLKHLLLSGFVVLGMRGLAMAADTMPNVVRDAAPAIEWCSNYAEATKRAEAEKKLLFLYFQPTDRKSVV